MVDDIITYKNELKGISEITWEHPMWTILMGIDHEKIHMETSAVLIRLLPLRYIKASIPG